MPRTAAVHLLDTTR